MAGWPWPLDGVQGWFEGLWNWISESAYAASRWLWDQVTGAIQGISSWITDGLSWLWDNITSGLASLSTWVTDTGAWLWDSISQGIEGISTWITDGLTWLYDSLQGAIAGISGWVSDGLAWFSNIVTGGVNWLGNYINQGLAWLRDHVGEKLAELYASIRGTMWESVQFVQGAVSGLWESLAGLAGDLLAGVVGALGEGLSTFWDWLLKHLTWISEMIVGAMTAVKASISSVLDPVLSQIVNRATEALIPGSPPQEIEEAAKAFSAQFVKKMSELAPRTKHSPPSLAELLTASAGVVGAGVLTTFGMSSVAAYLDMAHPARMTGIMHVADDLLYSLNFPSMIGPIIFSNIYAGIIIPLRYRWNEIYTPMIPPIVDLIRFVVREVIKPEEFRINAKFHGFSDTWANAYWEAHWVLPAFGTLVDAFHRGEISGSELDKFIVWHDYSPVPRPGIEKTDVEIMRSVLKRIIPRVDARYAWELGIWTSTELVDHYLIEGYEEDAELMAQIQMARALVEEIHRVRDEWIRDFVEGYILEGALRANLAEIGIGPERIEFYVVYAKKRRGREHRAEILDIYQDGYVKDLVTDEELEARAGEIFEDPGALKLFLERAYVRKYRKPKAG